MTKKTAAAKQIYQLKITLRGSKPPIWRRVLVAGDTRLNDVSEIILTAMGWLGCHLHMFTINGVEYGAKETEFGDVSDTESEDESLVMLADVAREKTTFTYEYDFGDSWEHTVLVEKVLPREAGAAYPRCIKGKRACPPEDCGGIWGYAELLETLADPDSPEYEEMSEWVDDDFDPDLFDIEAINHRLQQRNDES